MEKCVNEIRIWVLKRRFVNWSHGEKCDKCFLSFYSGGILKFDG